MILILTQKLWGKRRGKAFFWGGGGLIFLDISERWYMCFGCCPYGSNTATIMYEWVTVFYLHIIRCLPYCLHLQHLLQQLELRMSCCSLVLQQGASQFQTATHKKQEGMNVMVLTHFYSLKSSQMEYWQIFCFLIFMFLYRFLSILFSVF